MADSAYAARLQTARASAAGSPRHSALVRATHWITAACFFALLVTGIEIVISHPRFYWGETGNIHTAPLFTIPIPASRASVPTGYGYVLPDQNGWSRSLHFQSAWLLVITGVAYILGALLSGHLRKNLLPRAADLSWPAARNVIAGHLRLRRPAPSESWSYNVLQRLTYLAVVFLLFPAVIWTGLAMSPAIASVFPGLVTVLGGQQSARTVHFFITILLVVFVLVHLAMLFLAGFVDRTRAMITGRSRQSQEHA